MLPLQVMHGDGRCRAELAVFLDLLTSRAHTTNCSTISFSCIRNVFVFRSLTVCCIHAIDPLGVLNVFDPFGALVHLRSC